MNSTTVTNKLEILLYSTLINVMSGINRLKSQSEDISVAPGREISKIASDMMGIQAYSGKRTALVNWDSVQQSFLTLLLWIILGFAAGFLIGMVMPR